MTEDIQASTVPIRVLLVDVHPGWVNDVIRVMTETQADIRIVREVSSSEALGDVVVREECDVVVTSLSDTQLQPVFHSALFGPSHVAIVAIAARGRNIDVYDHRVVREVTPEDLLDVIREVAHRERVT
jgi:DNA-binding NarL/FixJ family response regulator